MKNRKKFFSGLLIGIFTLAVAQTGALANPITAEMPDEYHIVIDGETYPVNDVQPVDVDFYTIEKEEVYDDSELTAYMEMLEVDQAPAGVPVDDQSQERYDQYLSKCSGNYGYDQLSELQKVIYDDMYEQMEAFAKSGMSSTDYHDTFFSDLNRSDDGRDVIACINLNAYNENKYVKKDVYEAFYVFYHNNPQFYWFDRRLRCYTWNGTNAPAQIRLAVRDDFVSAQSRAELEDEIILSIQGIEREFETEEDVYERVHIVHDFIVNRIDYAYKEDGETPMDTDTAHSIVGVFNKEGVVCEGYAKSFTMLLNYFEIPSVYIVGYSKFNGTSYGGGHAWNLVSFDEGQNYYYIDATWDDNKNTTVPCTYKWYCTPKTGFESSHFSNVCDNVLNDTVGWTYALPTDIGEDMDHTYYVHYNQYVDDTSLTDAKARAYLEKAYLSTPSNHPTFILIHSVDDATDRSNMSKFVRYLLPGATSFSYTPLSYINAKLLTGHKTITQITNKYYRTEYAKGEIFDAPQKSDFTYEGCDGSPKIFKYEWYRGDYTDSELNDADKLSSEPSARGTYTLVVYAGAGEYVCESMLCQKVTIGVSQVLADEVELSAPSSYIYTGKDITAVVSYTGAGEGFGEIHVKYQKVGDSDFADAMQDAGTYRVYIDVDESLMNKQTNDLYVGQIEIFPRNISGASINMLAEATYSGEYQMPGVAVSLNNKKLTEKEEYTVSYSNNVKAGKTAKATLIGIGNYTGTCSKNFTILPKEVMPILSGNYTKVYDTTDLVDDNTSLEIQLDGVVAGDEVSATADFRFDSEDAGENKEIFAENITLTGADKDNYNLSATDLSDSIGTIEKAEQSHPEMPEIVDKTCISITLLQDENMYEYSEDGFNWQTNPVFSSLKVGQTYQFYQRKAETKNYHASEQSEALETTFIQGRHDFEPDKPICELCGICKSLATTGNHDFINEDAIDTSIEECSDCHVKNIAYEGIAVEGLELTYNGNEQLPIFTLKDKNGSKITDAEYEVSLSSEYVQNAGDTCLVTFTGKNNYVGTRTETVLVNKAIPEFEVPTDISILCNEELSNDILPDGFRFDDLDVLLAIGEDNVSSVTYTPDDTDNYEVVENISVIITVQDHSYEDIVADEYKISDATCIDKAVYFKSCSVCGNKSDITFESVVDPDKHVGETEIRDQAEATCSEYGFTGNLCCMDCGAVLEAGEVIEKTEHTPEIDEAVLPTCEQKGMTAGSHCLICNEVIEAQMDVDALGHEWDEGIAEVQPTCTEEGSIVYTCLHDDTHTKSETIDKLEHSYVNGICNICDISWTKIENGLIYTAVKNESGPSVCVAAAEAIMTEDMLSDGKLIIPDSISDGEIVFTVTEIAESAFENVSGFSEIVIPDTIEGIGSKAFANEDIKTISFEGILAPAMADDALDGSGITEIYVPDDAIGYDNVYALEDVIIVKPNDNPLPSEEPSVSPSPSIIPGEEPGNEPSVNPSPSIIPGEEPGNEPSINPSPSQEVGESTSPAPSENVDVSANPSPSIIPGEEPGNEPSVNPSPSIIPGEEPGNEPSVNPSPSQEVSVSISISPSPSVAPSEKPSIISSTTPSKVPVVGDIAEEVNSNGCYKVTSAVNSNHEVTYTKPIDKAKTSYKVSDTVTIAGVDYKITKIEKNAFKNNSKVKTVTVGKNIKSIGATAFKGCKKLKTLTIKTTKLTSNSVAKNAFKGLSKNTTIKVPKKKLKAYKSLFKKKGLPKSVKIKGI